FSARSPGPAPEPQCSSAEPGDQDDLIAPPVAVSVGTPMMVIMVVVPGVGMRTHPVMAVPPAPCICRGRQSDGAKQNGRDCSEHNFLHRIPPYGGDNDDSA